jgi:hypothetical protein
MKFIEKCNGIEEFIEYENSGVVRGKTSLLNYIDLTRCYSLVATYMHFSNTVARRR